MDNEWKAITIALAAAALFAISVTALKSEELPRDVPRPKPVVCVSSTIDQEIVGLELAAVKELGTYFQIKDKPTVTALLDVLEALTPPGTTVERNVEGIVGMSFKKATGRGKMVFPKDSLLLVTYLNGCVRHYYYIEPRFAGPVMRGLRDS